MTKRLLTEEEKTITMKNLDILKSELKYKENVELARKKFNLEIADLEVAKQKNELKTIIKKLETEVDEYKKAIEVCCKQIDEGVEIKEVVEDDSGETFDVQ